MFKPCDSEDGKESEQDEALSERERDRLSKVYEALMGLPYKSRVKIIRICNDELHGPGYLMMLNEDGDFASPAHQHLVDYGCWPQDE